MSELSMMKKEWRKGLKLQWKDGWMMFLGLCAGSLVPDHLVKVLSLCLAGYFFQKSMQEFAEYSLFFLVGSLMQSPLTFYQDFLVLVFFSLLIVFVRLMHLSMFHAMPWLVFVTGFVVLLIHTSNSAVAFQGGFLTFVLMKLCSSEKILVQKEFRISEMTFGLMLIVLCAKSIEVLSQTQFFLLAALLMLFSAYFFQSIPMMVCLFLICEISHFHETVLLWAFCAFVSHLLKGMKTGLLFMFPFTVYLFNRNAMDTAVALLMVSFMMCLPQRDCFRFLESENEGQLLKMRLRNKEQMLQHQLNQFSQIFDLISDYYEESHLQEMTFIKGMSSAMNLLSLTMKQSALTQEEEAYRIVQLLKGVQLDAQKVHVTFSDTGARRIEMVVECIRKDVEDVILPLIQMSIDANLKITSCRRAQRWSKAYLIELSGEKPLGLKTKIYRTLDKEKMSGDTCAVFQQGHLYICTISDGMGKGKEASKASGFVSYLMQRLISCKIPVEHCVRCINALCALSRKENFATMDFMCFDSLNHQMILSKNGAAPSYLIRKDEMIKIEGQSLPLGIVQQISADCYVLPVKPEDILLMSSDGVSEAMIEQWVQCSDADEIRKRIEQEVKKTGHRDDLSVILAEVL